MSGYNSLFDMKSIKYRPKNSLSIIKQINRFSTDSFENLKHSLSKYTHLDQKSFMLQMFNGKSVETFIFSIYSDPSGYFIRDRNIKHFHNIENALKYKLAKSYEQYFKEDRSVEYQCYMLNNIDSVNDKYDYVNKAYRYGQIVYIL